LEFRHLGDSVEICFITAPLQRPTVVQGTITRVSHPSKLKNWTFIALVVISNSVGNLFLGMGMKYINFHSASILNYAGLLLTNIWIVLGTLLMIVYTVAQLSLFSWADLSYVLPVTASSYILTAILSKAFLDENISIARWIGIVVISFGVVLVSETPPHTEERPEEGGQ
jgi:drug/metabolite transporter (DMT)-like permease